MVQVGGLATGLDVNGIVTQLVAAEITPAQFRLDRQEAAFQSDISALGTLRSALNDFRTALDDLDTIADLRPRTATSSNNDLFTVSADDTAVEGSYDIQVVQVAQEQQLLSGTFASSGTAVGTGTLTFTQGTDTFSVEIGAAAQTLDDVRDAINTATDNPGVRAAIINVDDGSGGTDSRLVLSAGDVGSGNALTITATDDDGNNTDAAGLSALVYPPGGAGNVMTEQQPAADAIIRVFNETITRSTNSISDAITGVTIDLKAATSSSGDTATASIALDQGAARTRVDAFVSAYNDLVGVLDALGEYDADTQTGGALVGDATLRAVASNIRRELSTPVDGLSVSTLAEIGITTQRDGSLSVDTTTLDSALQNDFDSVAQLFATEDTGYAARLSTIVDGFVSSDGTIESRLDTINTQLNQISDERATLERRSSILEERFRGQFAALDQFVSELNTIGSFLAQNLASLPGVVRRDS